MGRDKDTLNLYMRVGFIVVCVLSFFIAWFLSRWMSLPLRRLARLIDQCEPDSLPVGFSKSFTKDEVGLLAKALDKSMERVKSFLIREQQFTRDASHELRTPVTAMKGAVELLQQTPSYEDQTVNRLAKRMDQAVSEMEAIIEALLWLSREESSDGFNQVCEITPIVDDLTRQYQNQYKEKNNNTTIKVEGGFNIKASPAVVRITLSNLIRNAFQFTNQGSIHIRISDNQVEIQDTGLGISPDDLGKVRQPSYRGKNSQGFGFGLDIVNRLCDRFGWQLEIESTSGKGTTARLIFACHMG